MSSFRIQSPVAGSTGRVGTTTPVGQADVETPKSKKAKGINLFDLTNLPAATSVTGKDGNTLSLPGLSKEDAANMKSLFANVDESQQDDINDAGSVLGNALFAMLKNGGQQPAKIDISGEGDDEGGTIKPMTIDSSMFQTSSVLAQAKLATSSGSDSMAGSKTAGVSKLSTTSASGSPYVGVNEAAPSVSAATTKAAQAYSASNPNASYDNQVMAVTYMGVTNLQDQMTSYAQQVAVKQKNQSAISTDASELRQAVSEWPEGTATQSFTLHGIDDSGHLTTTTKDLTKEQASTAADTASNTATSMQDQSQTDMLRLQNMSQNYNNAISTISNLMKVSYDTVKNTVGNIHY